MRIKPRNAEPTIEAAAPRRSANRILQFIVAGGVGFGVDAAILLLLTELGGWQPLRARLVSFLGAVSVTWLINRHYTFGDRRARQTRTTASEYLRYVLTQSAGAAINLAIFAVALWLLPELHSHLLVPLALASACALFFNYAVMHSYVFPRRASSS